MDSSPYQATRLHQQSIEMTPLLRFKQHETCLYHIGRSFNPAKPIAGFDVDGTLIYTQLRFIKNETIPASDYRWTPKASRALKKTHNVVIFTNQYRYHSAIGERLKDLMKTLGIQHAFIAPQKDAYRKPATGMWSLLETLAHQPLQKENSFYIGDAGGRPADFSDSDLAFAQALGIPFIHIDDLV